MVTLKDHTQIHQIQNNSQITRMKTMVLVYKGI